MKWFALFIALVAGIYGLTCLFLSAVGFRTKRAEFDPWGDLWSGLIFLLIALVAGMVAFSF